MGADRNGALLGTERRRLALATVSSGWGMHGAGAAAVATTTMSDSSLVIPLISWHRWTRWTTGETALRLCHGAVDSSHSGARLHSRLATGPLATGPLGAGIPRRVASAVRRGAGQIPHHGGVRLAAECKTQHGSQRISAGGWRLERPAASWNTLRRTVLRAGRRSQDGETERTTLGCMDHGVSCISSACSTLRVMMS